MRTLHKTLASFGILATAAMGQLTACFNEVQDCTVTLEPCSGDKGGPPPGCEASPSEDPAVIRNQCGIFVSATKGDDMTGDGSQDRPYKTLPKAIGAASMTKRVYVCADGDYTDRVQLPAGTSLFGGFKCDAAMWTYDTGIKAALTVQASTTAEEVQAALLVSGGGKSILENVRVTAADAMMPGGSSIAMIADGSSIDLVRTELFAGNGAAGAQGDTPSDDIGPSDPTAPEIRGNDGKASCMGGGAGNLGGAAKANPLCAESIGGKGGTGLELTGQNGDDGQPLPNPNPDLLGLGGGGEVASQCKAGQVGANGQQGAAGAGALDAGMLDATKGYLGASGQPGGKGSTAQGGGGGGAAKGKLDCYGASGGSGGAGGCGGNGGLGGMAGGASIGIVSIDATLSFQQVTITTKNGGTGGLGGTGQPGASGGAGGFGGTGTSGNNDACDGGKGGKGGNGGNGGGGRGGHSIGIAHKGAAPSMEGVTIQTGAFGTGGTGADMPGNGADGLKSDTHAFP